MYYDLLARIKNGQQARKEAIYTPHANFDFAVAKVLEEAGYVKSVEKKSSGKKNTIEVKLKYNPDKTGFMTDFKIVSKPSRRIYKSYQELRPVRQNYGHAVLSTSAGILLNKQARRQKVGGEYLFEIW